MPFLFCANCHIHYWYPISNVKCYCNKWKALRAIAPYRMLIDTVHWLRGYHWNHVLLETFALLLAVL
jgi:hypothetical protein